MANLVLGYDDKVAGASITAGSAVAGLPGANVATAQPGQVWRSNGSNSTWLLADLGASAAIGVVLLGSTNLTAAATWRVRISTSDATGAAGDAYDSTTVNAGVDPAYGLALLILSSPATGRYLRVDLADAALGALEAGLLRALTKWQPSRNFRFGQQFLHRDFSRRRQGWDGQDWVLRGSQQRGVALTLPAVTTAEWAANGEPLTRISGQSRDVLVCLDPAAANLGRVSFFGLLEEMPAWERIAYANVSAAFKLWHRI